MGSAYSYLIAEEELYNSACGRVVGCPYSYSLLEEAKEREMIEMYENKNIYYYCKNYLDTVYNDPNSRRQTLQEEE